ncbi:MAG TPA: Ig-like domain-containing protein [Gemmatimonadales bacterium]
MTKPYHRRLAIPMALTLAALSASCGDVTLPDPGEAAELRLVDGNGQSAQVGTALGAPVRVRVLDTEGRTVTNQQVTFTVLSGGGSVEPEEITTNGEGIAAATWTLGPSAGTQELRASTLQGGSGNRLDVPFSATAIAGTGSVLVGVRGDNQTGPVNSALADSLVVKATDAVGNPVAGVEVTWSVTGGGSISPVTVSTDDDGLAAAERVLGASSGAQSARAEVQGFTGSPVVFSHTAVPANPSQLVPVAGDDQTGPGGFALADSLKVKLEDDNGNGIGNRSISWIVSTGSGSVSPTTVTTDPNGFAATSWTLPGAVGNYTVSAVFSGLPAVQFTAMATPDAPTTIELVSGNNQSATAGSALPNPLVVRVTDENDNPVANVGVTWAAQVGGSVSDATTATDANGRAQVTRTLGVLPGTYTTTATVDGLSGSPVTFTSTAQVGAPDRLAIITQPGSPIVSGGTISPAPSVQVQDDQQNPVPQAGIAVNAAITSGPAGGSLGVNDQRLTNSNGRANFANLTISGPPGDYVLTFTATVGGAELTPVSSNPITVTAGSAARLVVLQQPSSGSQSGDQFAQQPMVQVQDGSGNPINGNRTIAVELGQGDGDGQLTGDVTIATGSGSTATFTDLGIEGETGNYTLIFRSGTLQPAESQVIAVVNNPPTADDESYTTDEDVALSVPAGSGVLVGDSDPDGDNLTAINASNPAGGSVTLQSNGSFTYTPDPEFNGTDTFTYQVSDGRGNVSATATVTITVNPVNDAPGFTAGPNIEVSSLATTLGFTAASWASGITAGPPDESGQAVTFQVSTDNDGAFSATPQVDPSGTLTFTPQVTLTQVIVNASVVAQDNGTGTPSSAAQNFTITIDP